MNKEAIMGMPLTEERLAEIEKMPELQFGYDDLRLITGSVLLQAVLQQWGISQTTEELKANKP
jgi:hypothetical protein